MYNFDTHELGRTDDAVAIETRDENRSASIRMARQSKKTIEIISRELDPIIYDDQEFLDAVKDMILSDYHSRIRIIVLNPQIITQHSRRLITLAMSLTSFIDIRKPGPEYSGFNESLFIADGCGYIHRKKSDRYEGNLNFNDLRTCKYLLESFNEMWNKAVPDENFRKLNI